MEIGSININAVMKARYLKKLLNNTGYTVAFYRTYIGIGSPLCHDLIKVDIDVMKTTYALDTWRKGRESVLHHEELTFIWDKLNELIETGEIKDIISGNDEISNPLPVYTVYKGELISTFTDAYGWPNVTIEGYLMHDNDYFKTEQEALQYGISDLEWGKKYAIDTLKDLNEIRLATKNRIKDYQCKIANLKQL